MVQQPRQVDRQYVGFAGAHGLACMHLGTRGRQLIIKGRLRASGDDYAQARATMILAIGSIEAWCNVDAIDLVYGAETYYATVFDRFELLARRDKWFHFTAEGYVTCDFIMYGRCLI